MASVSTRIHSLSMWNEIKAATTSCVYLKPEVGCWRKRSFVRFTVCIVCRMRAVFTSTPSLRSCLRWLACWEHSFHSNLAETSFSFMLLMTLSGLCDVRYNISCCSRSSSQMINWSEPTAHKTNLTRRNDESPVSLFRGTNGGALTTKMRKLVMKSELVSCGKTNKMKCYNLYERFSLFVVVASNVIVDRIAQCTRCQKRCNMMFHFVFRESSFFFLSLSFHRFHFVWFCRLALFWYVHNNLRRRNGSYQQLTSTTRAHTHIRHPIHWQLLPNKLFSLVFSRSTTVFDLEKSSKHANLPSNAIRSHSEIK